MRLINGDALIEELRKMYASNGWSPKEIHYSLRDIEMNVQNYEIEAIPIERIMDFLKRMEDIGTNNDMFGTIVPIAMALVTPIIMALVETSRENKDI